jgi:drug/metabolite transporter (DMT)-like permease
MMPQNTHPPDTTWLLFSALTVVCWGLYGIFLHNGQLAMGDPVNGRYKAFLMVGVAYFLTAVLAPLALLLIKGASWTYPGKGIVWSLLAGVLGAIGALGVLLAFGAKGTPAVVMSIVFAGAPVINAVCALILHPPQGGIAKLPLPFIVGIALAAVGGCLVTLYKPTPAPSKPTATQVSPANRPPTIGTPSH